ncbi:hypothetical protein [Rhodococcoides corynebacterioides]|uniref:hypothetical protein n=1 Tax=Rhodococcoides corynebacterioides TaxID=53972 RepID=UPI000836449A|nr:hypothetical protein [Rhodococcus corynebacterioides]MBY6351886.1 hypothetical protein [Rhodococcus corynebacterioides]
MTERRRAFRGAAVGALTGALAVAAHATADGGEPDSTSLTLVALVSVGLGLLASTVGTRRDGRMPVAGWLAAGQVIAHLVLVLATGHAHPVGARMLAAHAAAVAVGAVLIAAAERLAAVAGSVLRSVRFVPRVPAPAAGPPLPGHLSAVVPVPLLPALSRRGPPSA